MNNNNNTNNTNEINNDLKTTINRLKEKNTPNEIEAASNNENEIVNNAQIEAAANAPTETVAGMSTASGSAATEHVSISEETFEQTEQYKKMKLKHEKCQSLFSHHEQALKVAMFNLNKAANVLITLNTNTATKNKTKETYKKEVNRLNTTINTIKIETNAQLHNKNVANKNLNECAEEINNALKNFLKKSITIKRSRESISNGSEKNEAKRTPKQTN